MSVLPLEPVGPGMALHLFAWHGRPLAGDPNAWAEAQGPEELRRLHAQVHAPGREQSWPHSHAALWWADRAHT